MEPRSILIFRNGSIGNTLVALPAIKALRNSFPNARMTAVLDSIGSELLKYCPYLDETITYEKHGEHRGLLAHLNLLQSLRVERPTHAVLFKRFFRNGLLAMLSGAPIRIGFVTDGRAPFLTYSIPYDESIHISLLNMRLVESMGAKSLSVPYELFLHDTDLIDAKEQLSKNGIANGSYLVLHYGGHTSGPDSIPPARIVELLNNIDCPIVLLGAGERERTMAAGLAGALKHAVALCDLPVRTMAAMIKRAACFIGFNSGPMHLAAAAKTSGIAFFHPAPDVARELVKWSPMGDTIEPMIPPSSPGSAEWPAFIEKVREKLNSILSRKAS